MLDANVFGVQAHLEEIAILVDKHGTTLERCLLPLFGIGVAMTVHQDHSNSPRASLNCLIHGTW